MPLSKQVLLNIARQISPPLLWSAAKKLRNVLSASKATPQYYGLFELDKKLEKYLDYNDGFFIEIGGWDGITFSNSLYFERNRGWRGLLIEPAPTEYLKCKKNRPLATVYCCACVPFKFQEPFLPMTFCASMTFAHSTPNGVNLIHDIDTHLQSGLKFLDDNDSVYQFSAVAKPLSDVIDDAGVNREIDLLILDVEGFELNVLRGIDFQRHGPKFICVEVRELRPIEEFLVSKGYRIEAQLTDYPDNKDYLFRRE
jgi:FkbM family methyltransferase